MPVNDRRDLTGRLKGYCE